MFFIKEVSSNLKFAWKYAKKDKMSIHNMNYWLNGNYYGFGLGAVSYLNDNRINNTKNIKQIGKRIGTFGEIHLVKNLKDEKEYANRRVYIHISFASSSFILLPLGNHFNCH